MLTEKPEDNATAESIIESLREVHNSTQETLRDLRVPENVIQLNTAFIPEFDKLLPDDVTQLYQDIKKLSIMYFNAQKFSQREISRRLKGESFVAVHKILKENKNDK